MLSGCAFLLLVPPAERTLKHNRDTRALVEKREEKDEEEGTEGENDESSSGHCLGLPGLTRPLYFLCALSKGMQPGSPSSFSGYPMCGPSHRARARCSPLGS